TDVMDRHLLARTGQLVRSTRRHFAGLALAEAPANIQGYLDVLTPWQERRSRDRFWEGDVQAIAALPTCLAPRVRLAAALLPMVTEQIWQQLTGGRSVHLTDWPQDAQFPADDQLVAAMEQVRVVDSAGNALRKKESLRARRPLAELTVVHHDPGLLEPFTAIIAEELNVKAVRLLEVSSEEAQGMGVEQRLTVNARAAGPRLGKQVQ